MGSYLTKCCCKDGNEQPSSWQLATMDDFGDPYAYEDADSIEDDGLIELQPPSQHMGSAKLSDGQMVSLEFAGEIPKNIRSPLRLQGKNPYQPEGEGTSDLRLIGRIDKDRSTQQSELRGSSSLSLTIDPDTPQVRIPPSNGEKYGEDSDTMDATRIVHSSSSDEIYETYESSTSYYRQPRLENVMSGEDDSESENNRKSMILQKAENPKPSSKPKVPLKSATQHSSKEPSMNPSMSPISMMSNSKPHGSMIPKPSPKQPSKSVLKSPVQSSTQPRWKESSSALYFSATSQLDSPQKSKDENLESTVYEDANDS